MSLEVGVFFSCGLTPFNCGAAARGAGAWTIGIGRGLPSPADETVIGNPGRIEILLALPVIAAIFALIFEGSVTTRWYTLVPGFCCDPVATTGNLLPCLIRSEFVAVFTFVFACVIKAGRAFCDDGLVVPFENQKYNVIEVRLSSKFTTKRNN